MADQRRRGRGRSGRGGRIPRKGEGQAHAQGSEEQFVSFPLAFTGPIAVTPTVDEAAVQSLIRDLRDRERRQVAALRALEGLTGDPDLAGVRTEIEQHQERLRQLARDLGADVGQDGSEDGGAESARDLLVGERLSRLGWLTLQRIGYASGDRRIDRVARPVLRDKQRHAEVLEAVALREAARSLFREPEE